METLTAPNGTRPIETVPSDPNGPEWLKRADAAALCSLSPSTFDRHAKEANLSRAERRGNHGHIEHVFRRSDVLSLLASLRSVRTVPVETVPSGSVRIETVLSETVSDASASHQMEPSHTVRNRPNADALLHGARIAAKLQAIRAKEARAERDRMQIERDQLAGQVEFLKEQLHGTQLIVAKQMQMLEAATRPALPAPEPPRPRVKWWMPWRRG